MNTFKRDTSFIPIDASLVEGKDYINISNSSSTELGRSLSMYFNKSFHTMVGNVLSIKKFLQYVSTEGYPYELLIRRKFTSEDKELLRGLKTISLPNYWSIACYVTCTRVLQDPKLQKLIYNNKLPFTIIDTIQKDKTGISISGAANTVNVFKLANYLAIIRDIENLIKSDSFNTNTIEAMVDWYRDNKEQSTFAGTVCEAK